MAIAVRKAKIGVVSELRFPLVRRASLLRKLHCRLLPADTITHRDGGGRAFDDRRSGAPTDGGRKKYDR
jgi:hypothetical protein